MMVISWLVYNVISAVIVYVISKLMFAANNRKPHPDKTDNWLSYYQKVTLSLLAIALTILSVVLAYYFPQVGAWVCSHREFWWRFATWWLVYAVMLVVPVAALAVYHMAKSQKVQFPGNVDKSSSLFGVIVIIILFGIFIATIITIYKPLPW